MVVDDRAEGFTRSIDGTVGELIDALSQYPRDTEVVVAGDDLQWRLVWTVAKPYGNDRLTAAVALSMGEVVR